MKSQYIFIHHTKTHLKYQQFKDFKSLTFQQGMYIRNLYNKQHN